MLDLPYLRSHAEDAAAALAKRGDRLDLQGVLALDAEQRELLQEVERLKQTRNAASKKIGGIVKEGGDAGPLRAEMKQVGERIREIEARRETLDAELQEQLRSLPNLPHPGVPEGSSAEDNPVVRTWGDPPELDFEPEAHWDLGPRLGILDFERAAKMSGSRYVAYVGQGALLERALIQFMLDLHTTEHGYTEMIPPLMVNAQSLFGTGQLPKFEEDLFRTDPGGNYLIPTAEVPVTNFHADEIVEPGGLPLAYCAYTPCFRSEAGSYGKDVRGLIRLHQFNKVELVRFVEPERSYDELEILTGHAEEVLRRLGLHYRVVELCAGDLGFSAAKTYDLEVWLPAQKLYREISSCSNFEAFQARRAKIRYRPGEKERPRALHTLNGSGLAVGRTVVAILESFQQPDGTVLVPPPLRPYMRGLEKVGAPRNS